MIYFITDGEYCKIGFAHNARKRIKDLQIGSARKLTLLATVPGGPDVEAIYHNTFKDLRVRGEWFRMAPELISFINANCLKDPDPDPDTRTIGEQLKQMRIDADMSLTKMAKELGITPQSVSEMEKRGDRMTIETARKYAKFFGYDIHLA